MPLADRGARVNYSDEKSRCSQDLEGLVPVEQCDKPEDQ
jgi:hypothetical protein